MVFNNSLKAVAAKFKSMLGIINDDPRKGPVRYRRVTVQRGETIPQGLRERRRRVKQIIFGQIPFAQLGGDPLTEFGIAKRNALVGVGKRAA
jgi:hypothetical protein